MVTDIFLDRCNTTVRVQPRSIHGMLWLQTHFEDSAWDYIQMGAIGISPDDAITLSQDAELSGLRVLFPVDKHS